MSSSSVQVAEVRTIADTNPNAEVAASTASATSERVVLVAEGPTAATPTQAEIPGHENPTRSL